jgi:serine protease Do
MEVTMQTENIKKKAAIRSFIIISAFFALLISAPLAIGADEQSIAMLRQMGKAFASIAEKASPAVVAVSSEMTVTRQSGTLSDDILQYFNEMQGRGQRQQTPPRTFRQTARGSGFIVSADGYILTNNHMIEEATSVGIELGDGRKFTAAIVGTEPGSDVAVLKIDAKNLPFIEMADSDSLEVGEWVLAIGNPLVFSHSVTAGIVSAKGRNNLGLADLENFIQTDAAINLGNSGGPLLNLDGKAIGINTAIVGSGSDITGFAGNIGIGFAIPINIAKFAYDQIVESGKVDRGIMGVRPKDLLLDNAGALGLENTKGVLIDSVVEGSPAEKAGLTHTDIILEVDGKAVETASELTNRISMLKPGTKVELTIWRNGARVKVPVELGSRLAFTQQQAEAAKTTTTEDSVKNLGLSVQELNDELATLYKFEGQSGVVVSGVQADTPAEESGIKVGTLIKEVNRQAVTNVSEFNSAMKNAIARIQQQSETEENRSIALYVSYNGSPSWIFIKISR